MAEVDSAPAAEHVTLVRKGAGFYRVATSDPGLLPHALGEAVREVFGTPPPRPRRRPTPFPPWGSPSWDADVPPALGDRAEAEAGRRGHRVVVEAFPDAADPAPLAVPDGPAGEVVRAMAGAARGLVECAAGVQDRIVLAAAGGIGPRCVVLTTDEWDERWLVERLKALVRGTRPRAPSIHRARDVGRAVTGARILLVSDAWSVCTPARFPHLFRDPGLRVYGFLLPGERPGRRDQQRLVAAYGHFLYRARDGGGQASAGDSRLPGVDDVGGTPDSGPPGRIDRPPG